MQSTLTLTDLPAPTAQTFRRVHRAEAARFLTVGGMRGPLITSVLLGSAAGVAARAAGAWMQGEGAAETGDALLPTSHGPAALALETGLFVAALVLALATVFRVCRDQNGPLAALLLLTPRRGRLVMAQVAALAGTAALTLTTTAVIIVAATTLMGDGAPLGPQLLASALGVAAGTALTVLAYGIAAAVRGVAAAILSFLAATVVLPLLLTLAPLFLPGVLGRAVNAAAAWLPTQAYFAANIVSAHAEPLSALPGALGDLGLLVGWAILALAAGLTAIRRRDA